MKTLREILRIATALLFIVSGFVKAVDVKGFSFKLEEYFSASVFNMPFFENLALPIAIGVVFVELLLGILLLLKIRLRFTLISLIVLCIFFAFLTFYSAYYDKVTDCGCFGDAIKLTPWQSFFKDIALLISLLLLYMMHKNDVPSVQRNFKAKILVLSIFGVLMLLIILRGLLHEPVIDFRAYKVGTDINSVKNRLSAEPDQYKTFYVIKNRSTSEEKKLDQDQYIGDKQYWEEGTSWEIQTDQTTTELVKKGYHSEIAKLRLEDKNGKDITADILALDKVILIFSYHPQTVDPTKFALAEQKLKDLNAAVYGVSPNRNVFRTIPNLTMDPTAIKTIARSNPFVLTLENGKIKSKKPLRDYINNNKN